METMFEVVLIWRRVKPINYDISLYDLELGGSFSYQGTVKIEVHIQKATKEIVINTHQLKLHSATVSDSHHGT